MTFPRRAGPWGHMAGVHKIAVFMHEIAVFLREMRASAPPGPQSEIRTRCSRPSSSAVRKATVAAAPWSS